MKINLFKLDKITFTLLLMIFIGSVSVSPIIAKQINNNSNDSTTKSDLKKAGYTCEVVSVGFVSCTKKGSEEYWCTGSVCTLAPFKSNSNSKLSGVFTIQQKSTMRYLDAHEIRNKDFRIVTRPRQNNRTQQWRIKPLGNNTFTIRQVSNGRYVDAHEYAGKDFGLVTRPNQRNNTQRWVIKKVGNYLYTIQQKSNGRFIDAHVTNNRDYEVVTRSPQNNNTQKWIVRRVNYNIRNQKPRVVVRRTRAINPLSGSPTDCVVKVTITSDTNFTSMTTDRGGGADSYDAYPVYIERMYILNAHTRKPYVTLDFNPSIRKRKNFTDHRTGEKYSTTSHTFSNILDGYTYIATLGGGWITEPSSVTFRCPNERGQREFSLPRIKHIGIMGDG